MQWTEQPSWSFQLSPVDWLSVLGLAFSCRLKSRKYGRVVAKSVVQKGSSRHCHEQKAVSSLPIKLPKLYFNSACFNESVFGLEIVPCGEFLCAKEKSRYCYTWYFCFVCS